MFGGCSSLTDIVIPDEVTSIGNYAFQNTALTNLTLPDALTSIGDRAFESCSALTEVHFTGDLPTLGQDPFLNSTPTIYYPADNATWTQEALSTYFNGFNVIPE